MKKLIALACITVLTACSGAEEAAEPATAEVAVEEATFDPLTLATAAESAGTYDLLYADGSTGSITLTADGSFSYALGEDTAAGTFAIPEPGHFCYTVVEGDIPSECHTNGPLAEDGTWTSTSDVSGDVVTVSANQG